MEHELCCDDCGATLAVTDSDELVKLLTQVKFTCVECNTETTGEEEGEES
jgi:hypothetical protein